MTASDGDGTKRLILNGDDLGMARSINRATLEALEKGWITSASAMVPGTYFGEVVEYARKDPDGDIGLHLTLTSESSHLLFKPVLDKQSLKSLVDQDGFFLKKRREFVDRADPAEVEKEIRAQIERACDASLRPTHLDSHMGALESREDLATMLLRIASEFGIPCRAMPHQKFAVSAGVGRNEQGMAYIGALNSLGEGVSEFILHLGLDDLELRELMEGREDWGAAWRQTDYEVVKSPLFQESLKRSGATLTRWRLF